MHIESPTNIGEKKGWIISYIAVLIAMMTMQMSSLGFSPLIPFMKEAWQMSYAEMGTFTGVYGLVALIMSVPAGLLIKRFGEKRVLSVGLLIASLGLFSVSLAENYHQGLGARALWIFGYRMAFVSVMTAIALTVPSNWKGKAMGLLGALSAMATVFGSGFSTQIEASFGWRNGMMGFALAAFFGVCIFFIFYQQTPMETLPITNDQDGNALKSPSMFSAFKYPIVWTIPLLGLTNAAGFSATFFVPSVVKDVFGKGAETSSTIIQLAYAAAMIVCPLSGWLADKFNRWMVMAGMVALMIPACIAMNSDNIYIFAAATAALVSLGLACSNQVYPTASELLRGRDTGPIMGIVALGGGLFGYLGPQALGSLRQWSGGFTAGWITVTCTTIGILILILFLKRYTDRQHLAS